jgi:PTH1 family peptidyl-tRNA hydrolase
MRLGIGRPPGRMPPAAYVLQDFCRDDEPVVAEIIDTAVQAVSTFLTDGINLAMSKHNKNLNAEGRKQKAE